VASKLSTLVDFFGGTAINTSTWNASSGSGVTLDTTLDRVSVSCTASYTSLGSTAWDATGSSIYVRVSPAPVGNGSTQTQLQLTAAGGSNKALLMCDGGGTMRAAVVTSGSTTASVTIGAYDAYNHAWWRIRESAGVFYFDTSADGWTWTQQAQATYSWTATAVTVLLTCGYYGTEAAGMVAYFDHVNTMSSAPGQLNLAWPSVEFAWAPYWNCNGGDLPLDRYVDVTSRTRGTMGLNRGRQYELDQVRSSELTAQLANTDGALDPNNASGPWFGHIQPYQPTRVRAQWPPTRNLLTQVQATGGDLGGFSTGTIPGGASGIDVFSLADSSGGTITASTSAWQGSNVFQFSVPSGTAAQTAICFTLQPAVQPGVTYTVQMQVRNVTASASLQVDAWIVFSSVTGAISTIRSSVVTLTGSATAPWTLVTVTATAPANTARVSFGVETGGTAAATCSVQVDGWQWEKSSTPTTWVCPGVTYPVFGGFVERWPSQWSMSGTYGTVQPTAVDALSLLSQVQLSDPLIEEINSHSPRFLYTLGDPQGAATFTDATGQNKAAAWQTGKYGPGSLTSGNQITSATSAGAYTGSSDTVVTINNPNPGTNIISGATFISLTSAGITGPANPSGSWTRMIAFRYTGPTPSVDTVFWSSFDRQRVNNLPGGSQLYWGLDSSGKFGVTISGPTNNPAVYIPSPTSMADSNWHLGIASYNHANGQLIVSIDGNALFWTLSSAQEPTGLVSDNIGAWVDPTVGNGTYLNYKGDLSFVAEFPSALSSTDMTSIYNAWKTSCSGESTDARYNRILRYAGYTGLSSVQAGLTTSMGPASFSGQDALSALQAVVDTESGEHFVARDGTLTFKSRSARYNSLTPAIVFGENAGEIPYEDAQLDYDPTHLSNLVTITQASTNQTFVAQDATSQTNYFPRSLTRTVNSSSALECQDAAGYLLSRYKNALTRVQSLKLHPAANPALWPTLLGLELGTRVRVMRRPPSPAPAIQVECYAEGIQWDWDDQGEAYVTLQCSPADLTPYALFAAFHTTLNGSPAAGVTSITINAGADNQNAAASQLGQGQQLVLGLGTANQETVTISSVSTTSAGWTTAVITLQAATTKSHTSGDTVCEPLPSGITSATTWDAMTKFDACNFAY
jgi:hypothetical protein